MKYMELNKLTGKMVKEWYAWLRKEDMGCCSVWFASTDKYRYCVCMGWHDFGEGPDEERGFTDGFRVAWKIGRQTHNNIMQCDLDVDFEMPYVTEQMAKDDPGLCEGGVDDTIEEVECEKIVNRKSWRWSSPIGYRGWDRLAARMRKVARRVYRDWRGCDE